jgi:hypothetical protein
MCVFFVCESKWPTEDELVAAGESNSDGAGIAWINHETKKVEWIKGLKDGHEVQKILETGIIKHYPAIIHFRIASIGGVLPELTHPFPLTPQVPLELKGIANAVLFHNGTWNSWNASLMPALAAQNGKWPAGPWSDTRALAWFAARGGSNAIDLVYDNTSLKGDRIAILSGDGKVYTRGHFDKKDGFLASNSSYEYRANRKKAQIATASGGGGNVSNFPRSGVVAGLLAGGGRVTGSGPLPTAHIPGADWVDTPVPGVSSNLADVQPAHLGIVLRALRAMRERDSVSAETSH